MHQLDITVGDRELEARVWDFGGQQFLHASHRFFLGRQRGLYVIALDASREPDGDAESNQLSYWVRMVQQYGWSEGERAPLLIVLTQCDREDSDEADIARTARANRDAVDAIVSQGVIDEYDFIDHVGWHTIAGQPGQWSDVERQRWDTHVAALQSLHKRIEECAADIPGMSGKFGPDYFAFRDWVIDTFRVDDDCIDDPKRSETIKRFDHKKNVGFLELCEKHDITPASLLNHLESLHSTGILHWIGFREDIRFKSGKEDLRAFVANPEWLKSPTYAIIRAQDQSERGFLSDQAIHGLLEAPAEPIQSEFLYKRLFFDEEDRDYVLHMMLACRVAVEAKGGLLLPDHLNLEKSPTEFMGDDVSRSRFEADFFPEHVFLLFVAKHQHLATSSRAIWRNELLIPWEVRGETVEVLLQTDLSPGYHIRPGINLSIKGGTEVARDRVVDPIHTKLNDFMQEEGLGAFDWKPKASGESKARKPGRPVDTDHESDRRIFEAWNSKRFGTYADLARELDCSREDVKKAVDRERKRRK